MTDNDYERLKQRVVNGKKWMDKIKVAGEYDLPKNQRLVTVYFKIVDRYLAENMRRAKSIVTKAPTKGLIWFEGEWHSKAWVAMKEREKVDEERRTKARVAARERAERKRKGVE